MYISHAKYLDKILTLMGTPNTRDVRKIVIFYSHLPYLGKDATQGQSYGTLEGNST